MNMEAYNLLHAMPANAPDDACDLTDLDHEHIPWDRVPKIKELMHGEDAYIALRAAMLLSHWGMDEGFDYLKAFVCDRPPLTENWMPHRLRAYDDTYKHVLDAFVSYWAKNATKSDVQGTRARARMKKPVDRLIQLANVMPFGIEYFFWLVEKKGFTEYLPALKEHLIAVLKHPELHHWKIADCAHLLTKFDPAFVEQALAAHGKTLADFPIR